MTSPDRGPPLILVAEDEPLASMALRAQLEALGFHVLGPARNGDQAVMLGSCYPVDVALFDYRMPARSGLEAAYDIFEIAPTPVVLLTGFGARDLPEPIPSPPVFGLLSKPVDLADLDAGIGEARAAFRLWSERTGRDDVARALEERATIGRAVDRLADGPRKAAAAGRFLQQARDAGQTPIALARSILAQSSR